jgi:RHS repeat-associated protein
MLTASRRNNGSDDGSAANLSVGFDTIGNLSNRSDTYGGSEQFCYDALNRLTRYSLNGASCHAGGTLKTVSYDDIGNITMKSDLSDTNGGTGAYAYNLPTHPLPHAVMSISGTVNGVQNPGYRYDADGNLTCEYTGPNCSHGAITKETDAYWSFNMTHTIGDGATSLTLTYDSEHARITQLLTTASTNVTTNYLNDPISGAIAEKVVSGSTNTWNDYLMADGKLVGERICTAPTPSCPATSASWQYFILDHLGSVSVVTDGATKQVTARESFDAWGKQRNPDWSDDATCSSGLTAPTTRGFTSQEDIAALCLVNLNARLYDPSIGRFMSADSFIADPTDPQAYNRYTYVNNRPLSLTDPTGHDPDMSQNFMDAHPEMTCMGSCGGVGGVTVMTGTMSAPDGTFLGTYKIVVNSNGNMAMGMNCGEGCGALGDMVASNMGANSVSISDPQQASQTQAGQHVQDTSDAVETVSATGGASASGPSSQATGSANSQNRYIYADDNYGEQARKVPNDSRGFLIFAHGIEDTPGVLFRDFTSDATGMSAEKFAEDMKENPTKYNYTPGRDIVLAVCFGGTGSATSSAAIFAKVLNVTVYGSEFYVGVNEDQPPTHLDVGNLKMVQSLTGGWVQSMELKDWTTFQPPPIPAQH